jgi:hypothetical protein
VHRGAHDPAVRAGLLVLDALDDDLPAVLDVLTNRHDPELVQGNSNDVASLMLVAPRLADSTPTTLRSHEPYALTTRRSPSTAKSRQGPAVRHPDSGQDRGIVAVVGLVLRRPARIYLLTRMARVD